ncbi:MAG: carboxypeptidase regulatory-like domain-containing protein, partial [Flavisolibacter sp.]
MRTLLLLSILLFCSMAVLGQTRKITGQVKDDKGEVLPFATITEVGTTNAVQADQNGSYTITVQPGARVTATASGHQAQT